MSLKYEKQGDFLYLWGFVVFFFLINKKAGGEVVEIRKGQVHYYG